MIDDLKDRRVILIFRASAPVRTFWHNESKHARISREIDPNYLNAIKYNYLKIKLLRAGPQPIESILTSLKFSMNSM